MLAHIYYPCYYRKPGPGPTSGYYSENWQSFCMIMMNVKGPCVSLRLTFLGGTDSIHRSTVRIPFSLNLSKPSASITFT